MNSRIKYDQFRPQIGTGDVIAFQGKDFFAGIIQKRSKSPYSHVGLIVRIKEVSVERVFILESVTGKGVVLLPLSRKIEEYNGKAWWLPLRFKSDYKDASCLAIELGVRAAVLKYAMGELGKKYDTKHIMAFVKQACGDKKIPQDNFDEYICSELVAAAYKIAGMLPKDKSTALISPADITNISCLGKPRNII